MLLKLAILFVGVPLLELAILVELGTLVGFWPTMALVLATGALGSLLARRQGFRVWTEMRRELQAGRMPVGNLLDAVLILVGGLLLLTPGLLSDLSGLVLLLPPARNSLKRVLRRRLERMIRSGQVNFFTMIR